MRTLAVPQLRAVEARRQVNCDGSGIAHVMGVHPGKRHAAERRSHLALQNTWATFRRANARHGLPLSVQWRILALNCGTDRPQVEKGGRMSLNSKNLASLLAVPTLLCSLSAARADVTMDGSISVPKSIQGVQSFACDDFAVAAYNPPDCPPGRLCPNLGSEIKSETASGNYASGKCSYSVKVPENKKFLISVDQNKHTPKCEGAPGTVLSLGLSGPTGPFEISGLPSGVSIKADFKLTATCEGPPK
jgi:hypothetical protein